MTANPNIVQRLIVLKDSFDKRRLRMGFDLLRRGNLRTLALQVAAHTAFRWRLRQFGLGMKTDLAPPADEPDSHSQLYHEGLWPNESPLISVVIPCFNYGAFVAAAVDSVLDQTWQDLEIIVVEGGSTDTTTRQTVAALRRPKTLILFRDTPCPVGDNRNFGISQARGKYICCLDADDVLQPTYLEKAVFLMETCGYDVVSASVKRFGAIEGGYGVMPRPDLSDILEGNHVTTCAVFRRRLWEQAGGYKDAGPDMPFVHEDWRFWVRLAALGARILNISGERLIWYRAHPGPSLSSRPNVLPNRLQAPLVRELNQDVITPETIERSRIRASMRLRSLDGMDNLTRQTDADETARTIMVVVPHLVVGGAERLLSHVVGGLRKSGYRIIVVTTVPTFADLGDTTSWFERITSSIYHLPRFLPQSCWLMFVEYLVRAKRVNTILLAGSSFFYDAVPELKLRHPHLRVVDLLFNTGSHALSNRKLSALIDLTVVEGEDVRSWLLARGEEPGRIRTIPSGVNLQWLRPIGKPAQLIRELGFPSQAFIVGFSGRLAEEKAPLSFLKIATAMRTESLIHFIMTGTGPLEEKVRAALRRAKLGRRFHFAGLVTDIRDYLACYDVLVLPSLFDGRPNVVMEALAMGIPVVASKVGSLPSLVIHGETGFLCEARDIRAFAAHVQWLYDHPRERVRMGEAARRFAEEHLCLEAMVSRYVRVFDESIGNAGAGPASGVQPLPEGSDNRVADGGIWGSVPTRSYTPVEPVHGE